MVEPILLETFDLCKGFPIKGGLFRKTVAEAKVLQQVNLQVPKGRIVSLVGESGCGKTTFGRVITGLYPINPNDGAVLFDAKPEEFDRFRELWKERKSPENGPTPHPEIEALRRKYDFHKLSRTEQRQRCRENQMVFQDPYGSLNPRFTVLNIVAEGLRIHKVFHSGPKGRKLELEFVQSILERSGIDPSTIHRYPHEFSGGQRQRLGIARVLALRPKLVVLDEPVSALDVSVQIQIIDLFNELKREFDLTYIFIAHDLSIVDYFTDDIAVMYLGHIVEYGHKSVVNQNPLHPYTQALISAVPTHNPALRRKRIRLSGEIPSIVSLPTGCPFHTRCPHVMPICREKKPPLRSLDDKAAGLSRKLACWKV
ncbi:MAG: oligopeptide/dipeptide ABC transporter ATP-binding protein [Spirochaetota bacterium]